MAIVLVVIGLGIFSLLFASRPQPQTSPDAGRPPTVIVMAATPQMIARRWEGYGTARALDSADVPARVTATVEVIPPNILEGVAVSRGDLLVQLDDSDFQRQLEIAQQTVADLQAQLERLDSEQQGWTERLRLADQAVELAEADLRRITDAFESGVAKQREVDQARQSLIGALGERVSAREELDKIGPRQSSIRAQIQAQQSSRRLAEQNVERSRITAPISGVLQFVDVEIGENVTAGQRVARIVNLEQIEVPIELPAAARSTIAIGDEATLTTDDWNTTGWTGRIARIAPEDNAARRTMTVYIVLSGDQLNDAGSPLPPGRFVRAAVLSHSTESRFVVPRRAMLNDHVLVVQDGIVTRQSVDVDFHIEADFPQLGLPDTQWVVLAEPLPTGALVVADVGRSLRVGTTVEPVRAGTGDVAARPNGSSPTGASP